MVRRPARVLAGASACACAATLALSPVAPAQAASSPGWRVVFSHHYGGATTGSGYLAVASPGKAAAWAVGGADGNGNPATGRPVGARWQHGSWRAIRLPSGLSGWLGAVSADSAKDAWAVSIFTGYVLHWNGDQVGSGQEISGARSSWRADRSDGSQPVQRLGVRRTWR